MAPRRILRFRHLVLGLLLASAVFVSLNIAFPHLFMDSEPYCIRVNTVHGEHVLISPHTGAEIRLNAALFNRKQPNGISPDRQYVVYSAGRGSIGLSVMVKSTRTGSTVNIVNIPGKAIVGSPEWSHDGKKLAFVSLYKEIVIANADGSDYHVVSDGSRINEVKWSPDDQVVYSINLGNITVVRVSDLKIYSSPVHVSMELAQFHGRYFTYVYDENVFTRQLSEHTLSLGIFDIETGKERELDISLGSWSSVVQVSQDGRYVVARKIDPPGGQLILFTLDADHVKPIFLDNSWQPGNHESFSWSADQKSYVFIDRKLGALLAYSMADGKTRTLVPDHVIYAEPARQAGQWLVWQRHSSGGTELQLVNETTGIRSTLLKDNNVVHIYWLSDTSLLITTRREQAFQLLKVNTVSGSLDTLFSGSAISASAPAHNIFWQKMDNARIGLARFDWASQTLMLYPTEINQVGFIASSSRFLFSPDGRYVVVQAINTPDHTSIQLASSSGEPARILYEDASVSYRSFDSWKWSPDSAMLVYRTPDGGFSIARTDGMNLLNRPQQRYLGFEWVNCSSPAGDLIG